MVKDDDENKIAGFGPKLHQDPLCRVVLVEPLIPENTGNISRTCVATHSELHLVEPMAFEISESRVKRAGLDYWENLAWWKHASFAAWRGTVNVPKRVFYVETSGERSLYDIEFQRGDTLVFGKETSGLTPEILHDARLHSEVIHIPMPGTTRSLNLSNAVAVSVFEILRQTSRK